MPTPEPVKLSLLAGQWIAQCPHCDETTSKQDKARTCGAMQTHLWRAHDYPALYTPTFTER
jgi:hypothetical protein